MLTCGNCGMDLPSKFITLIRTVNDVKQKPLNCCDKSCAYQYQRELEIPKLKKQLEIFTEHYNDSDNVGLVIKKYIKSVQLFISSILARKPRNQLVKLQELMKRCICDMCEWSLEHKYDDCLHWFSERFTTMSDLDMVIEIFCAPNT